MDNIILTPVPLDQLIASITASVIKAMKDEQKDELQEKLLTTAEVSKLFGVSPVTISAWIKKDLLKKHTIGGRNRFKYSEVMESLKTLKKYKLS